MLPLGDYRYIRSLIDRPFRRNRLTVPYKGAKAHRPLSARK
jgi:hypothetical protein